MNLRQLINSTKKTVSNMFDTSKDFTQKPLGQVISVNTDEHYDNVRGLRHMVMYITAVTQTTSTVQLYDKPDRRKKEIYKEPKRQISTHTVGISFSGYYRMDIPLEELSDEDIDLGQRGLTGDNLKKLAHSFERHKGSVKDGKYNKFIDQYTQENRRLGKLYATEKDYKNAREQAYSRILSEAELYRRIDNYIRKKNVNQELKNNYIIRKEDSFKGGNIKVKYNSKKDEYNLYNGTITIETPIYLTNIVRVRCTCAHFYYTYAWYNSDHNALIGEKPAPYIRVEKGWAKKSSGIITRRNLNKVPGLCKHLQFFVSYLIQNGIIQETQNSRTFRAVNPRDNKAVGDKLHEVNVASAKLSKDEKAKLEDTAKQEASMQRHDMELSRREAEIYTNWKRGRNKKE